MPTYSDSVSQRASDVRSRRPQAKIGAIAAPSMNDVIRTLINSNPQAAQVSTITVDAATNSHEYIVTVDDVEVSYTSDATATVAEIANALEAAIDAEPRISGKLSADSDGVSVVTLTGSYPGLSFTLETEDADLTVADTTAAGEADDIPFGRAVLSTGYQTDEANQSGVLVAAAALTAQVETITVDFAAGEVYYITVTVDGVPYFVGVAADTDDATTATAIRAALNAILPATTVVVTGATDQVILTAELVGKGFTVSVGLKSGTIARLALVHTTASLATDLGRCLRGVSLYTHDEQNLTVAGDDVVYPANSGVKVLARGEVWVANSESIAYGDVVYVGTSSTEKGKFFNSSSATRIRLDPAKATWVRGSRSGSGDDIAVLQLNLS